MCVHYLSILVTKEDIGQGAWNTALVLISNSITQARKRENRCD